VAAPWPGNPGRGTGCMGWERSRGAADERCATAIPAAAARGRAGQARPVLSRAEILKGDCTQRPHQPKGRWVEVTESSSPPRCSMRPGRWYAIATTERRVERNQTPDGGLMMTGKGIDALGQKRRVAPAGRKDAPESRRPVIPRWGGARDVGTARSPVAEDISGDAARSWRVHQIELDMQNEELAPVRQAALGAERERYVDLYDQAPGWLLHRQ